MTLTFVFLTVRYLGKKKSMKQQGQLYITLLFYVCPIEVIDATLHQTKGWNGDVLMEIRNIVLESEDAIIEGQSTYGNLMVCLCVRVGVWGVGLS